MVKIYSHWRSKTLFVLVSSRMTSTSGQLVQRIRLHDEEESPAQNNIMVDDDLLQYYQLLADRGDAQAQVRRTNNSSNHLVYLRWFSMALVNCTTYVIPHSIRLSTTSVWRQKTAIPTRWPT